MLIIFGSLSFYKIIIVFSFNSVVTSKFICFEMPTSNPVSYGFFAHTKFMGYILNG